MKKGLIITIIIILAVIIFAIMMRSTIHNGVSQDVTKCIGQNSALYIQLGCHACETQKELFGENSEDLTIIDCFYEREKCADIQYTPTWIINGKKYIGVQSIEELKEITGCQNG
jgi:hypothetical protein